MEELNNFKLLDLHAKLALPDDEFDAWLQNLGLLHRNRICICGALMVRKASNHNVNNRYGNWRCNQRECRAEKGFLMGTFFAGSKLFFCLGEIDYLGSHLSTKKIFALSYYWSQEYGKLEQIEREIGIGREALVDWRNFFRDVCAEHLSRNLIRIGGPGILNYLHVVVFNPLNQESSLKSMNHSQ